MAVIEIAKIQVRRGQELQTGMPQLDSGEFGWAEDTEHLYIGKRIVDGAVDDDNSRILTENDLTNIFHYIATTNSGAITSTYYQYRDDVPYISTASTVLRTVKGRLEDRVSLSDFGVVQSFTATDITLEFKNAIETLFRNQDGWGRQEARRILEIPAGKYILSETVYLPPYTVLKGQGADLTVLTYENSSGSMFRTEDASQIYYEDQAMQSGAHQARALNIEGMSMQFSSSVINYDAIVSIDNASDVRIKNCNFRNEFDYLNTTTFGVVDFGIGVRIRGALGQDTTTLSENIYIENCKFTSLQKGIDASDSVVRPVISENWFYDLQWGVYFHQVDGLTAPSNGVITKNRFENIEYEGIYVGDDSNHVRANHVSSYNYFVNVGNQAKPSLGVPDGDPDRIAEAASPVITYLSAGNKTVNDYFHRRDIANGTTATSFYYNPLVQGSTALDDDGTYTATTVVRISRGVASQTEITKFPITTSDQLISVRYILSNELLHRKGTLSINLTNTGESHVVDNYNYIDYYNLIQAGLVPLNSTSTGGVSSGVNLFAVNTNQYGVFDRNSLDPQEGTWFVCETSSTEVTKVAMIIGETRCNTSTARIFVTDYTDSSGQSTPFDFTTPGVEYSLLQSNGAASVFTIDTSRSLSNNYVSLVCSNLSTLTNFLEYQVNIVS
jgi:hypothetical protein